MPRIFRAREQAEMLLPWRKTADDLMTSPALAPSAPPSALVSPPEPQPPTITNIPREDFDKVMASKGVTYDQHLDNLESHFNAATAGQQRRGRVWYRAGGDILSDIGKKFGISTHRAIAMAAALSGRTDWNDNLHFAAHMAGHYRPGENEDEWRRAAIHPAAMARYMEERHGIVPAEKKPGDLTDPGHFTARELEGLKRDGYMPRTKADFEMLANKHGGNHWQYVPPVKGRNGGQWVNAPLRGFEALQTPEGREDWLRNAQMPHRGVQHMVDSEGNPRNTDRARYEDVIDAHIRNVKQTKSAYGYMPDKHFMAAGLPTLSKNVAKAKLLRTVGEDEFDTHLNGQKYRAFFANLGNKLGFRKSENPDDQGYYDLGGKHWTELDPELLRSTVDTQHMRAASMPHGSDAPAPNYTESSQVSEPQYEVYQQGLIDLTHRINSKRPPHQHLLPHQVQAIIWGKFKDDQTKKGTGQKYWSPTMEDITPFGDRYSRFLTAAHVHPRLLEPPASDPHLTNSKDWFEAAMASWERLHQHELAPSASPDREIQASFSLMAHTRDVLAWVDRVLGGR